MADVSPSPSERTKDVVEKGEAMFDADGFWLARTSKAEVMWEVVKL